MNKFRSYFSYRNLFILVILIGAVLRLIWPGDMEYKEDEDYMYQRLLNVGSTEPWPWLGISSGVFIRNPGLSVWVFLALGKLVHATDPIRLLQAVQLLNVGALFFLIYVIHRMIKKTEREPWFWAAALAAVNPFAILYHRKIWAQSVLPFFTLLFFTAWWRRDRPRGAFFYGLIGACLGQIHMTGFFFAAGFAAWALLFDRKRVRWGAWVLGSTLGALPLIPWLVHVFTANTGQPLVFGLQEATQLKFWVFWMTDPLGLHLGNPLGILNGNYWLDQLRDFFRYPLVFGVSTYGVAVLHGVCLTLCFPLLGPGFVALWKKRRQWPSVFVGRESESAFTQNAALWGYGLLITLAGVMVHRFYLIITFPLEFLWLARMALSNPKASRARIWLGVFVFVQLLLSLSMMGYLHVNGGSMHGDYGRSYQSQVETGYYNFGVKRP